MIFQDDGFSLLIPTAGDKMAIPEEISVPALK
jgi:hypothetical protein